MIKLKTSVAGDDFAYKPGEIVELDKAWEQRLIDSDQAVAVRKTTKKKTTRKAK